MSKSNPSKNFMNADKHYRLRLWMETHRAELSELCVEEAAKEASAQLKFPVTENNVRGVNKNVMIEFKRKKQVRPNGHAEPGHRGARVPIVAEFVAHLYRELDLKAPPGYTLADLKAVVNRTSIPKQPEL